MRAVQNYNYMRDSTTIIRNYPSYGAFLKQIETDPDHEHSTTMFYYEDVNYNYYLLDSIRTGTDKNVVYYGASTNAVAVIHSHPASNPSLPSLQDVLTTAYCASSNPKFQYFYTYVNGDVYAFRIEDRTEAALFYRKYQNSIDPNTNMFKKNSEEANNFDNAQSPFENYGTDNQYLYGLTYFLDVNNSGIKVMKKSQSSDKFETMKVKHANQNGKNYVLPTKCQ